MNNLKYEILQIDKLIPYVNNQKKHPTEQVEKIMGSIKEFGVINPIIVDKDNVIIAGHGRYEALKRLGYEEVPVLRAEHLTPTQVKAYRIADNKLAELAIWDEELLAIDLSELDAVAFDMDVLGFNENELNDILNNFEIEQNLENTDYEKADEVPEIDEENIVIKRGDLIELGEHRLLCGDSTNEEDVKRLMNGEEADMVFTDPPYNVAFNGRSGKFEVIKNDNLKEDEFEKFINKIIKVIKMLNPESYYIWCNWKFYGILQNKLEYKACIVWAKNVFGLGKGYRHQHEFCLFNGEIDEDIKNESDLWEIKKDTNYIHPTQKPVALAERALKNHKKAKNIIDIFLGSGSTLIACENLKRKCYGMELDEKYAQVIIQRWCDYTGIDEIKINGEKVKWSEYKNAK